MRDVIENKQLQESYHRISHPSGLTVLLYPMPGFSSAYALFGTRYGSIDTTFKTKNDEDFITVPEGVAHFLEHKLFESEDGTDAFERFAATGASSNAFTSFDRTCYEFTCTDRFGESLEILLDFVQHPYFTEQTVQKEQGIIGQEIRMLQDRSGWQVMFNLLRAMYHNHPVRIDIGGTVESIAEIDANLLYRCYHTFYNLNNMVLAVAGNFDVDAALAVIDRGVQESVDPEIEHKTPEEPETVLQAFIEERQEVAVPEFQIGFKELPLDGMNLVEAVAYREILVELIAGEDTDFYRSLYDQGLINSSFGAELFSGPGYFADIFAGESKDPVKAYEAMKQELLRVKKTPFSEKQFETAKKAVYGRYVRLFNNVEEVASALISAHLLGVDVYDSIDSIAKADYAKAVEWLQASFDGNRSALSVIWPVNWTGGNEK